ncbi:hypothetical protein HPP92_004609 [Vanilla planifolia]|uniref:CHD3-type chromatin-remodeling factor PICKLE n=1 Tax=Vanilla planifolia TaxID=51239 RepID=A0A835RZR8_VANPL|nr:hypothetical protein HPP92_004609 [Vanilla planifolia]
MSSLVERLRIRSEKRPLYHDGGSDEEEFAIYKKKPDQKSEEKPTERIARADTKEYACQACGESGHLFECSTCTYAFHQKCLIHPRKASNIDDWSCPECVNPLNEVDKILDYEVRATAAVTDVLPSGSKRIGGKHYLVKWKGLSYLHCTWVPEEEFRKACKVNPRLRTRLNTFQKQMASMDNTEDDWIGIRPEWTTVDRIIATRKTGDEREYFVKWKELPYDECSWEVESDISIFQMQIEKVMYFGSAQARAIIREYEFFFPKGKTKKNKKKKKMKAFQGANPKKQARRTKFDVLLTSYEMINMDSASLKSIKWECMIVDEGHRLKNKESKLFLQLKLFNAKHRVLLTGTPLQNNLDELFMLMHFLDDGKFPSIEDFQMEFKDINQEEQIARLHKMLAPHLLRKGVEPETEPSNADEGLRQLLDSSGKMQLLDKMMVKLKLQGHRVLIYSQFQHMLDLLEDYLSFKKWNYERIDGRIGGAERQIRIDRFNAKNSTRFCFLLSTRAGGLGINLATADTVIIYDSDWNPHADLQAMARAHRLGQTNKVMIYRLITRGTIEERMMQMTKKKMILEHLVEELDDIIRYGSKELFAEESDEAGKSRQIHYDDAAIDRLLNRDEIGADETSMDDEDDDLLKAFKVANFEYIDEIEAAAAATRAEEAKKQSMAAYGSTNNPDRANYWDELLRDRYEVIQIEESTAMGKGKRNRKQMLAAGEDEQAGSSSEDEDYSFEDELSDTDGGSAGQATAKKGQLSRKRSRVDLTETHPLMEGEGRGVDEIDNVDKSYGDPTSRSFKFPRVVANDNTTYKFVKTHCLVEVHNNPKWGCKIVLVRFGFGKYDWKEFVPRLKGKSLQEVYDYGFNIYGASHRGDGVPKEGVRIDEVLIRIGIIQSMEEKTFFSSLLLRAFFLEKATNNKITMESSPLGIAFVKVLSIYEMDHLP